jgi:hypothetical protein
MLYNYITTHRAQNIKKKHKINILYLFEFRIVNVQGGPKVGIKYIVYSIVLILYT